MAQSSKPESAGAGREAEETMAPPAIREAEQTSSAANAATCGLAEVTPRTAQSATPEPGRGRQVRREMPRSAPSASVPNRGDAAEASREDKARPVQRA